MEQKRINRKALTRAVCRILSEERIKARDEMRAKVEESMEMDEKVLVLRTLIELHPSLKEEFNRAIEEIKSHASANAIRNMPYGWIQNEEVERVRGRLELLTDTELQALSLEEVASQVRD